MLLFMVCTITSKLLGHPKIRITYRNINEIEAIQNNRILGNSTKTNSAMPKLKLYGYQAAPKLWNKLSEDII